MKYLTPISPISIFFFRDIYTQIDLFIGILLLILWALTLMFISFSYLQHRENEKLKEELLDRDTRLGRV